MWGGAVPAEGVLHPVSSRAGASTGPKAFRSPVLSEMTPTNCLAWVQTPSLLADPPCALRCSYKICVPHTKTPNMVIDGIRVRW